MGARECFIYSTNKKYPVERLAELMTRSYGFLQDEPRVWLVCKAVAVNDLHKDSVNLWGEMRDIEPVDLKKGQETLCVGYDSGFSVRECLPFRLWKDLIVVEGVTLCDMPYEKVWKDEPLVVNGKTYFAELDTEKPVGLDEKLGRAEVCSGKTTEASDRSFGEKGEVEVGR